MSLSYDGGVCVAIGAPLNDGNGSELVTFECTALMAPIGRSAARISMAKRRAITAAQRVVVIGWREVVAIGAPLNDGNGSDAGHVRVYRFDGGNWVQLGADIDGEAAGDHSGSSVSLSQNGGLVAIGAPLNDGNGGGSGHVRVYAVGHES